MSFAAVLAGLLLAACSSSQASPSSATPPTTAVVSAVPSVPPTTLGVGGPSASIVVSGGRQLTLELLRIKCERAAGADGSSGITLLFRLTGQPAWDFEIGASSRPGQAFDHPVSISMTSHSIDDPYSGAANFLDSAGSTGSGWTIGGPHGVLLPGTIKVNADLAGSIDAPMKAVQTGDQLPDIHVVGHWTCSG